jgi:hypothetical protein
MAKPGDVKENQFKIDIAACDLSFVGVAWGRPKARLLVERWRGMRRALGMGKIGR